MTSQGQRKSECRIEGEAEVKKVLQSFDAQWNLGDITLLTIDRYEHEGHYAGRYRLYMCASHYSDAEQRAWVTFLFEGCSEIRIPEIPDLYSAFGLTVEDISDRQWDRIRLEVKCITEDHEWHEGLLWLRCDRARIIAVARQPRYSTVDDAIWIDTSAMPILDMLHSQNIHR